MRAKLSRLVDAIRTGFWFLPMVMLAAAAGLAILLLYIDRRFDPGMKSTLAWAYSGGAEGARSLLSTIAGSMITAASVTFSLASVALSIASQQYGSRVLRNFMRDRITQVLLGTFVATFIYCVLVVRAIRGSDMSGGFVPAISVTVAIVLSLVSLVLLIYFIHHVSSSIQASRIIRVIAESLEEALPELYPTSIGQPARQSDLVLAGLSQPPPRRHPADIFLSGSGYLQTVDLDKLLELACKHNLIVQLLFKPGDHLFAGATVGKAWKPITETPDTEAPDAETPDTETEPSEPQTLDPSVLRALQNVFFVDRERTPAQDIRYHFQQLTDVIVRALSPGINDPFTAINGIDELASAMLLFSRRAPASEQRQDENGTLRLLLPIVNTAEILTETVGHIAIYAASDAFVMSSLRRVLDIVSPLLSTPEDRDAVTRLRQDLDTRQKAKAPH